MSIVNETVGVDIQTYGQRLTAGIIKHFFALIKVMSTDISGINHTHKWFEGNIPYNLLELKRQKKNEKTSLA